MSRRIRSSGPIKGGVGYKSGGWMNVCNIDFRLLPDQTMTKNSENTVGGHTFWVNDLWDTANNGDCSVVNGTGLVCNFSQASSSNKHSNFLFKGTGIPKLETGGWPCFRIVTVVKSITFRSNLDAVKLVATGHPWEDTQRVPILKATYRRETSSNNEYHLAQRTGGPYATGSNANSSDIASGEPSELCMQLFMRPETGRWEMGIIENPNFIPRLPSDSAFTTIAYGRDYRTHLATTNEGYWDGDSNTGPYLGLALLARYSGGTTESCTVTRLLIQKYVGGADV
jgi:hypothetical protein